MSDSLRTVVLDANRTDALSVAVDTALRGVLRIPDRWLGAQFISRSRLLRRLIGHRYEALSYMADWREAFSHSPELDVTVVNITNLIEYRRARTAIRDADLVIVLHSAAGDDISLLNRTAHWLDNRRGKLCTFIGNEYELLDEKRHLFEKLGVDYVCSQLPLPTAEWLYADGQRWRVLAMPHALNPDAYRDLGRARTIDIGFVGDLYERTIGDTERTDLIRYFERDRRPDLSCAIRLNRRIPRDDWNAFLNQCHGIIGAESGSYYLDRRGSAIERAKSFCKARPDASFEEVFDACFRDLTGDVRSGKTVSSRHFEPIGARTCQLLIEGDYSGILRADEHYITIRKDLSDINEAIERFRDPNYRLRIVDSAYEHVLSGHTYAHRVRQLIREIESSWSVRPAASG